MSKSKTYLSSAIGLPNDFLKFVRILVPSSLVTASTVLARNDEGAGARLLSTFDNTRCPDNFSHS